MAFKVVLAVCVFLYLSQSALGQCLCRAAAPYGIAAPGLAIPDPAGAYGAGAYGAGCGGVASSGGGYLVSSASPIFPIGISVVSEIAYEGILAAGGNLPFLSTVAIEGVLPTAGAGGISYGCGNSAVGISSEGPINTGIVAPESFAPAGLASAAGYGLGSIAGYGLPGPAGYGFGGLCSDVAPSTKTNHYSTVAIEGVLPTAGAGGISYGCGNSAVGISSEGPINTGIVAPESFAPAGLASAAGYGLGSIAGYGLPGPAGYGFGGLCSDVAPSTKTNHYNMIIPQSF